MHRALSTCFSPFHADSIEIFLIALEEFRMRGREACRIQEIDLTIVKQEAHLRGRVQLANSWTTT